MNTALDYLRQTDGIQHEALKAAAADGTHFSLDAMKDAKKDWSQEMLAKHPGNYNGMCYTCGSLIPLSECVYSINGTSRCEVCFDHIQSFNRVT